MSSGLNNLEALISRAKELSEKASMGPWMIPDHGMGVLVSSKMWDKFHENVLCEQTCVGEDDLKFIAFARQAVPELASALEEALKVIGRYQRHIENEIDGVGCHCSEDMKREPRIYCDVCEKRALLKSASDALAQIQGGGE